MTAPIEVRQQRLQQLIGETPQIIDAIQNNNIGDLYYKLPGLLNLRSELRRAIQTNDGDQELKIELALLEQTIGRILVFLGDWHGIDQVSSRLYLNASITTRGEVHRLSAPIYDFLDEDDNEVIPVPLIGVVGKIASGKGTIGDVIAQRYKGLHLPLSDRLREFAVAQGSVAPHPREVLRDINDMLKPRFGNPVFVRWTMEIAQRLAIMYEKDVMSLDGFRSLEEALLFQKLGGKLIAVQASFETRYSRLLLRNRGADDFDEDSFRKSDELEGKWIDPILEIADVTFDNEGSIEDLEAQSINYIESLN